ncbi:Hypothetical_protein [Hexamita inflata]|uniref:Hypothetical_protein n=1 Tax=Hexamita inflata TaxID=28002 RepID=A0AA86R6N5_9EUKA|nr:Hypothetical protein HINF_LOCUS60304 [Hexamita inflata]
MNQQSARKLQQIAPLNLPSPKQKTTARMSNVIRPTKILTSQSLCIEPFADQQLESSSDLGFDKIDDKQILLNQLNTEFQTSLIKLHNKQSTIDNLKTENAQTQQQIKNINKILKIPENSDLQQILVQVESILVQLSQSQSKFNKVSEDLSQLTQIHRELRDKSDMYQDESQKLSMQIKVMQSATPLSFQERDILQQQLQQVESDNSSLKLQLETYQQSVSIKSKSTNELAEQLASLTIKAKEALLQNSLLKQQHAEQQKLTLTLQNQLTQLEQRCQGLQQINSEQQVRNTSLVQQLQQNEVHVVQLEQQLIKSDQLNNQKQQIIESTQHSLQQVTEELKNAKSALNTMQIQHAESTVRTQIQITREIFERVQRIENGAEFLVEEFQKLNDQFLRE